MSSHRELEQLLLGEPKREQWSSVYKTLSDVVLFMDSGIESTFGSLSSIIKTEDNRRKLADSLVNFYAIPEQPTSQFSCALNLWVILLSRPDLVFPIGYDEMRFAHAPVTSPNELDPTAKGIREEALEEILIQTLADAKSLSRAQFTMLMQHVALSAVSCLQYRTPTGTWHPFEGIIDRIVPHFDEASFEDIWQQLADAWIETVRTNPKPNRVRVWMPGSLVYSGDSKRCISDEIDKILTAINLKEQSLQDLHWRTFEEIVGELLKRAGLAVEVTKRSWDGGRDLIARGELIPGEPTTIAVEVKHKSVVPIDDFRAALHANRHYPAVLFATSGRFSAGILREREKDHQRMRIFLKDGGAIRQWINTYSDIS